jgi:tetratricopeptide (TPR) repeat protein
VPAKASQAYSSRAKSAPVATGSRSVESLALNRKLEERRGVAVALNNLGWVASYQGDYRAARRFHQESLALRREIGDQRGIAFALCNLAAAELYRGNAERAAALLRRMSHYGLGLREPTSSRRVLARATSTRASLKQAPPPRSARVAGARALAVAPLRV